MMGSPTLETIDILVVFINVEIDILRCVPRVPNFVEMIFSSDMKVK